jgi:hypothetical protein
LVLLLIVVLWGIFLGPSLIRRLADRRSGDSIGSFHRQLGVLRRTGPALVPPAHRLETIEGGASATVGASGLPVVSSRPSLVVVRTESRPTDMPGAEELPSSRRHDAYFRPAACKRRRDVLLILTCAVLVTALIGVIPGARPALLVTAFTAVVLGGYVALLVHGRNAAMERQAKLHYLPAPVVVPDQPIQVRRTATR